MKSNTTEGDTTLQRWRRELATTNLEQVKRPVPVEQWVSPAGMAPLDAVLCSVAYGATLTLRGPSSLGGGRFMAQLESETGARYAEAESDNLAHALVELAKRWSAR